MPHKIVTVVGARPQFIKAAVVSRVLGEAAGVTEVLVHTGQHYDEKMSDVFFHELGIPKPNCTLGVGSGSHGAQTGRMLEYLEEALIAEKPDMVLVYGDTNSTLAGALSAVKLHIPVAHVEAGLRSYNRLMPEEINRILTDHCADILFAPTQAAAETLIREGIAEERIYVVGDVMYDAALYYGLLADRNSRIIQQLGLVSGNYVLCTVHRAENTDSPERLRVIVDALSIAAEKVQVVLPVHPRTKSRLIQLGLLESLQRTVTVVDPVGYLDMVMLEKHARLIVTDSGGVQKEAFFHRVPCVTLRDETEWVELVSLGWNELIPPDSVVRIVDAITNGVRKPSDGASPYGDGRAAEVIKDILGRYLETAGR